MQSFVVKVGYAWDSLQSRKTTPYADPSAKIEITSEAFKIFNGWRYGKLYCEIPIRDVSSVSAGRDRVVIYHGFLNPCSWVTLISEQPEQLRQAIKKVLLANGKDFEFAPIKVPALGRVARLTAGITLLIIGGILILQFVRGTFGSNSSAFSSGLLFLSLFAGAMAVSTGFALVRTAMTGLK